MRASIKLVVARLMVAALMFSGLNSISQAADLAPNQISATVLTVPGSYTYSNIFNGPGSFVDGYAFTITAADFNTAASTISFDSTFGISGLSAALFSGVGTSGKALTAWSTFSPVGTIGELTLLNTLALSAGTYTLGIKGDITGSAGGSYSGVLNLANSSPVPEPSSGLVILIGIGMVAFQWKRKQGTAN